MARLTALFISIALMFWLGEAEAAKRVALVIGNDVYANLPQDRQLKKAINDAKAMRQTLERDLGFAPVFYGENADYRRMNALMAELETATEAGDIVFLYFSGHGVSLGAENYLMPSDVPKPMAGEEARLAGNSFGADALTRRLQKKGARAIFAVLDACRDNPFEAEGGKATGGPSGLQKIDAAKGVFMLFAAGLGQVALDRLEDDDPNPNSVFTRSLIPLLKQGGLSQVDLAKAVQGKVAALAAKIGHVQEPAYYDQILGFVELKDGDAAKVEVLAPQLSTCALEWPAVETSRSAEVVAAFRDKCAGDSLYRSLAGEKLALMVPARPLPPSAPAASQFDGLWKLIRRASNSACGWKELSATLPVEDGKINTGNWVGKISADGTVSITHHFVHQGKNERNILKGKIRGDIGRGRFFHAGGECEGTIELSRP